MKLKVGLACLVAIAPFPALGQGAYPSKGVEIVVPYSPGGGTDITARLVASYASKKWDHPVNVINMPGGSTITGSRHVLVSRPDGYTLLLESHGSSTMLGATQTDLPYRWDERRFIARIAVEPIVYVVRPDGPWRNLKELANAIRQSPGKMKWGVAGITGFGAFAVGQFLQVSGLEQSAANRVAFKSGAESLTNVAGGHVDFAAQGYAESTPYVTGSTVKALAVISDQRLPAFPNVPTAAESGFPNLNVSGWQGLSGPKALPDNVVAEWNKLLAAASRDAKFLEHARKANKRIAYLPAAEFEVAVQAEYARYVPMAEKMGIRK